jgi:hypothetical protein
LDEDENTLCGDPIEMDLEFGPVFPTGNPKEKCSLTQAWLLAKPTPKSVEVEVSYALDGSQEVTHTINTLAGYYGGLIGADLIGQDIIGHIDDDVAICPFPCVGECGAVRFHIKQTPPENDPGQPCEIYGIIYQFETLEDSEQKQTL